MQLLPLDIYVSSKFHILGRQLMTGMNFTIETAVLLHPNNICFIQIAKTDCAKGTLKHV